MDGNYAPGPLHHELNEEATQHQQRRFWREYPERDQKHAAEGAKNDYAPATPGLGKRTDDGAATDGAHRINDADYGFGADPEAALFLEIGRVKILRAVGHVIECGHEEGRVKKERAVLPDEHRKPRPVLVRFAMFLPDR